MTATSPPAASPPTASGESQSVRTIPLSVEAVDDH
jgi:hypothetical protein